MKKVILILLLSLSAIGFSQEKALLRLNYEKGDVFVSKLNTTMVMGDKMNTNLNIDFIMEVLNVKGNVYDIKATFPHVTMDMSAEGKTMKYDSNVKEENMDELSKGMHQKMKPMIDAVVNMKIDKRGNILSSEVVEGGEDYIHEDKGSTIAYPEKAVVLGTTWTETKESAGGGVPVTYTYKVTSITKDKVGIDIMGLMEGFDDTMIKGTGSINRVTGNLNPMDIEILMDMFGQKMITKANCSTTKRK